MPKVNAQEYTEKWGRNLKAAVQDIRRGVERLQQNPCELAAAAQDKMLARLTEAVNNGKWAAGLRRVTLQEWRQHMLNKGVGRIAAGVDGATTKMTQFAQELLAYEENLQRQIAGMPDVTLEDSIARAVAWIRGMSQFRRGGGAAAG